MAKKDDAEAAFYANADNLRSAGKGRRVRRDSDPKPLSSHVPIRFESGVIAEIKRYADEDGGTVSSWIRRIVMREVVRRRAQQVTEQGATLFLSWTEALPPMPAQTVAKQAELDDLRVLLH